MLRTDACWRRSPRRKRTSRRPRGNGSSAQRPVPWTAVARQVAVRYTLSVCSESTSLAGRASLISLYTHSCGAVSRRSAKYLHRLQWRDNCRMLFRCILHGFAACDMLHGVCRVSALHAALYLKTSATTSAQCVSPSFDRMTDTSKTEYAVFCCAPPCKLSTL